MISDSFVYSSLACCKCAPLHGYGGGGEGASCDWPKSVFKHANQYLTHCWSISLPYEPDEKIEFTNLVLHSYSQAFSVPVNWIQFYVFCFLFFFNSKCYSWGLRSLRLPLLPLSSSPCSCHPSFLSLSLPPSRSLAFSPVYWLCLLPGRPLPRQHAAGEAAELQLPPVFPAHIAARLSAEWKETDPLLPPLPPASPQKRDQVRDFRTVMHSGAACEANGGDRCGDDAAVWAQMWAVLFILHVFVSISLCWIFYACRMGSLGAWVLFFELLIKLLIYWSLELHLCSAAFPFPALLTLPPWCLLQGLLRWEWSIYRDCFW